jgi:hypothetical protein
MACNRAKTYLLLHGIAGHNITSVVRAFLVPHHPWAQALYRRLDRDYSTRGPWYSNMVRPTQTTQWATDKAAYPTGTTLRTC